MTSWFAAAALRADRVSLFAAAALRADRSTFRRASRLEHWLGAAVLGLAVLGAGCEEEIIMSQARPPPSASARPTASAAPRPPPHLAIDEAELVESEKSRDPFRSFAKLFAEENTTRKRSQREVVLPEYSIDELKLIGIVTRINPAKAMLVDPKGKGHVVRRGQFVGRPDVVRDTSSAGIAYQVNWRVDSIRDGDLVLVREDPTNPDVPTVTRVIPLRLEEETLE